MRARGTIPGRWSTGLWCAAATAAVGFLALWVDPVAAWLERLSFDLPFLAAPAAPLQNVVYVQLDEISYRVLKQPYQELWDRDLYTKLLDQLTRDGVKLVVFDLWFSDAGPAAKDRAFAAAIRRNGRTVLSASYRSYSGFELGGGEPIYPRNEFKDAAAGLGVVVACSDKEDGVIREIHPGFDRLPSLAWRAAALAGGRLPDDAGRLGTRRWMNYPSSLDQLRQIPFCEALTQPIGYFSNKVVFVGKGPLIKLPVEPGDEFPTPFRRFGGLRKPGGVIQLVMFLNLVGGTWLESLPAMATAVLIVALGSVAGLLLSGLRPHIAFITAGGLAVCVCVGASAGMFLAHRWFPWMVVVAVQLPLALSWSVLAFLRRPVGEERKLAVPQSPDRPAATAGESNQMGQLPTVVAAPPPSLPLRAEASAGPAPAGLPPSVPDHSLLKCIGSGAYGQVWLAQDVIGSYHAVKFVLRESFTSATPFEREFQGIHHFTPISRMHPGFVHILHVGRNDPAGYFFYIMELGDDEATGQTIVPAAYVPKTLSRMIHQQGRLQPAACLLLGLELSSALEFLHQHQLIHRDIKPSNIIFVHGKDKFADVGLVTQISAAAPHTTYLGTVGYIAPEGPGSPAADLYSLGKVLYEASMGLDPARFPDLPTEAIHAVDPCMRGLKRIILKACESKPEDRYQDARILYHDLQALVPEPKGWIG